MPTLTDTLRICRHCRDPLPSSEAGSVCVHCRTEPGPAVSPSLAPETPVMAPSAAELAKFFPQLEIIGLFGQGGMGMIYKARQPQLDRLVALKILSPALSRDPAFAERFSREAKALARLSHSHIVSLYDFGRAGEYYYFVMEFVDGVNLFQYLRQEPVGPGEARRIVTEVCQALQYAHEEGIVHRDIKPSNILLDKKGRVKIADFGLARLLDGEDEPCGPHTSVIMGTPNYMAPEQVEKPTEVDHRADVYSLGVVYYEMLTGELPLGHFDPPSRKAKVDSRLDAIVLRALDKNPYRRFQSANEVRSAIEMLTPLPAPALPATEPVRPRRVNWLAQAGLMAGAGLATLLLYFAIRDRVATAQSGQVPAAAAAALGDPETPGASIVNRRMIEQLKLTRPQVQEVNKTIHRSEQEFTRAERRHTERDRDAAGHTRVTINPFPAEMNRLLDEMWGALARTLSPEQITVARTLHFERFFPHSGTNTVKLEIWRDPNGEYHYVEADEPGAPATAGAPTSPQLAQHPLPLRYRSLLDATPAQP